MRDVGGQVSRVSILSPGVQGRQVEWQAARATNRGTLLVAHPLGVPVVAIRGAVVCCPSALQLRCPLPMRSVT